MADVSRPAYYAAGPGRWRDWWTLLHPPYTAWHLSYVVLGAALAPRPGVGHLLAAVTAFFFALGLGAHALDERNGRPLRTAIPDRVLVGVAAVALTCAVALGAAGVTRVGWVLIPFIVVGAGLLLAYNLELAGGRLHTDFWFAAGWGAFPVLTGCVAQHGTLDLAAVLAAVGAFGLSAAQRALSTPARLLRRRTRSFTGTLVRADGTAEPVDGAWVRRPLEAALQSTSWAVVALAAAVAVARLR